MENQPPQNPTPNQPQSPANPVQPAQTPPPLTQKQNMGSKKKFSLKLIIGVIIFLLLAGGAAAGYVYRESLMKLVAKPSPTPAPIVTITPTPTSTMQTYTNRQYGFSFEYPNEWFVEEDDSSIKVGKTERIEASGVVMEQDYTHTITIVTSVLEKPLGLDELQRTVYESNSNIIGITTDSVKKTVIGGKNAVRFDISQTGGYSWHGAHIVSDNYLIRISGRSLPNSDLPTVFDLILSTFKFTQNQNEDLSIELPSDWQIVKNSDNEIKIAQNDGMNSLTLTKYQNQNLDEMIQLAKKGIVRNLNSAKHVIDGVEVTAYSGCLNPEVCDHVTNIVLPVQKAYYILHAPDIDPTLLDQILSGIRILQKN